MKNKNDKTAEQDQEIERRKVYDKEKSEGLQDEK